MRIVRYEEVRASKTIDFSVLFSATTVGMT